jgi:hypothetical protein
MSPKKDDFMKKTLSARPSQISCVYGPPQKLNSYPEDKKKLLAKRAALRQKYIPAVQKK